METAAASKVDRGSDYDQTALHVHSAVECPRCHCEHTGDCPPAAMRDISPDVWQHRYLKEKQAREFVEHEREDLAEKLSVANDRIDAHERINAELSAKVDETVKAFENLTGEIIPLRQREARRGQPLS